MATTLRYWVTLTGTIKGSGEMGGKRATAFFVARSPPIPSGPYSGPYRSLWLDCPSGPYRSLWLDCPSGPYRDLFDSTPCRRVIFAELHDSLQKIVVAHARGARRLGEVLGRRDIGIGVRFQHEQLAVGPQPKVHALVAPQIQRAENPLRQLLEPRH